MRDQAENASKDPERLCNFLDQAVALHRPVVFEDAVSTCWRKLNLNLHCCCSNVCLYFYFDAHLRPLHDHAGREEKDLFLFYRFPLEALEPQNNARRVSCSSVDGVWSTANDVYLIYIIKFIKVVTDNVLTNHYSHSNFLKRWRQPSWPWLFPDRPHSSAFQAKLRRKLSPSRFVGRLDESRYRLTVYSKEQCKVLLIT